MFRERCVQRTHHVDRIGGQVEPRRALAEAFEQTVLAGADLLHIGRCRQRCEDEVGGLGDRAGALRPGGARVQMPRRSLPRQVVYNQLVPGLLQVAGHPGTHHAEADEPDFHVHFLPLLSVARWLPIGSVRRRRRALKSRGCGGAVRLLEGPAEDQRGARATPP
jgi:hypothetical protein